MLTQYFIPSESIKECQTCFRTEHRGLGQPPGQTEAHGQEKKVGQSQSGSLMDCSAVSIFFPFYDDLQYI